jgi:hypothetical protein
MAKFCWCVVREVMDWPRSPYALRMFSAFVEGFLIGFERGCSFFLVVWLGVCG